MCSILIRSKARVDLPLATIASARTVDVSDDCSKTSDVEIDTDACMLCMSLSSLLYSRGISSELTPGFGATAREERDHRLPAHTHAFVTWRCHKS
jgi:hypothetical protein